MSTAPDTRMFVKYSLFKVRPEWKRLPKEDREDSKTEFCEIIKRFEDIFKKEHVKSDIKRFEMGYIDEIKKP